jgi:antitoxin (DNA-binding transcriptional repressor) of toxin-antitoxin stability system
MTVASIRDAKNRLTELARQVEAGETIVVTRNGRSRPCWACTGNAIQVI